MTRKVGRKNNTTLILSKILNEKVVTESDLLRIVDYDRLNVIYHKFVAAGFPIKRKTLEKVWVRTQKKVDKMPTKHRTDHRIVIYYVE